jgi:hypothetical protein
VKAAIVEERHRVSSFDPEHLPKEILLTEALHHWFAVRVICTDEELTIARTECQVLRLGASA